MPLVVGGLIVVLIAGACSSNPGAATPATGQTARATAGSASSGSGASLGTGSGSTGSGSGSNAAYKAGTATATVQVAGTPYSFSGGTCKQDATVLYLFELLAGEVKSPPYLDVYVADPSTPLHDGDYSGDLTIVTIVVQGSTPEVVQARVTLSNGLTAGTFTGTSAGTSPKQVSGTFTC